MNFRRALITQASRDKQINNLQERQGGMINANKDTFRRHFPFSLSRAAVTKVANIKWLKLIRGVDKRQLLEGARQLKGKWRFRKATWGRKLSRRGVGNYLGGSVLKHPTPHFGSGHDLTGLWVQAPGQPLSWCHEACLGFSLSLCPSPTFMPTLSLKINLKKKSYLRATGFEWGKTTTTTIVALRKKEQNWLLPSAQ